MRYRRISYRYSEATDGGPRVFTLEAWDLPKRSGVASPYFRPAADVFETVDSYLVVLELAGVADDEVMVSLHPDALVVSGRRRCPAVEGARYHAAEIRYGPFRFDMSLPPDVDLETVEASTERGLVRVSMRKRAGGVS